jgi:two-component system sensor histidine kinase KdpD
MLGYITGTWETEAVKADTRADSGRTTERQSELERGAATGYIRAGVIVGAATTVAAVVRATLHVPDVEMLFMLAVTVVAVTSTRGPSIFAAVLCVAAYDFFFVAPPFTFDVEDARYVLTFAMMLGIGLVISNLTVRLREQELAAVAREQRTSALYDASRGFAAALDGSAVASVCAGVAEHVVGGPAAVLGRAGDDTVVALAAAPPGTTLTDAELEVARWTLMHGSAAGGGAGPFPNVTVACLPVRATVDIAAVLALRVPAGERLRSEHRAFLEALCRQSALALERVRLATEARTAALSAEAERLRSALLSAVSHDLRTPLASITGAATTLRDAAGLEEATRRELVDAVCEEAERLERLVRNLLDMTRLESGAVQLRREWVPVEEVVGGALTRLEVSLTGRRVTTSCPDDLPLVYVDPVLLEQLFVNLVENATKYTPQGSPIEITALRDGQRVVVDVTDRGPGIPPGMEEQVFERFRRGVAGGVPGVGLGLAICRAIAQAHGGELTAENRQSGGARFRVSLPLGGRPPPDVVGERSA